MSRMYYTKVNFPRKKWYSGFDNFNFFLYEDSREIYKFTDLEKFLNCYVVDKKIPLTYAFVIF